MPWMSLASLVSIARRLRLDMRRIEIFVEEDVLHPGLRNQEKPYEASLAPEDDQDQYGEEKDEY